MSQDIIPSWPNLKAHNDAWDQAKVELGKDAGVRALAVRAQEILTRNNMLGEPEDEYIRRRPPVQQEY